MKEQTYIEVVEDEAYNKGFIKGRQHQEKRFIKLLNAARNWMQIYESSFGEPNEECKEFFELKKLINQK